LGAKQNLISQYYRLEKKKTGRGQEKSVRSHDAHVCRTACNHEKQHGIGTKCQQRNPPGL